MREEIIYLAHGGGGTMGRDLIRDLFVKHLANPALTELGDAALLSLPHERVAFTTDAFVVRPLCFPGGDIGKLAICGTINDLAVSGARPIALTASFILEEGLELALLEEVVRSMAATAVEAGVAVVAGDTKVVERGRGDGIFITTAGVGELIAPRPLRPGNIQPGDAILISGPVADHGIAILTSREGLTFQSEIQSDCAALHSLAAELIAAVPEVRFMRDPTRGGIAALLNETAEGMDFGIAIEESSVPVRPATASACELLGIDPLHVANEGKLVAFVPASEAQQALAAVRAHPLGREAAIIGKVTADHPGRVALTTLAGTERLLAMPAGELLPRIC